MSAAAPDRMLPVTRLRAALEELAGALAHGSLDRLLACEGLLEASLRALPVGEVAPDIRAAVRAEVEAARIALVRCRRLGLALDEFVTAGLAARGTDDGYGPTPASGPAGLHSLDVTV